MDEDYEVYNLCDECGIEIGPEATTCWRCAGYWEVIDQSVDYDKLED